MGWIRSNRPDEGPRAPSDRLAAITPGVPGRCPACDGLGYIDNIDLGHRYQIQHCKDCGHRWEYLFDEHGTVVGLTELDEGGQPRSRTRIRPLRAPAPEPPAVEEAVDEPAAAVEEADEVIDIAVAPEPPAPSAPAEDVIDLRQPVAAPEPVPVLTAPDVSEPAPVTGAPEPNPEEMSPAEWLRHSMGR